MTNAKQRHAVLMLAIPAILAGMAISIMAGEPVKVSLLLPWAPQAQFAGFYMAVAEGEYAKRGVKVDIYHSPPLAPLRKAYVERGTDFLVCSPPDALRLRDAGFNLRLLAQMVQRSNLAIVTWRDSGIETPGQFHQRRVSMWPDHYQSYFQLFFRLNGARPVVLPQAFSLALFLNRAVDACVAMSYNELHMLAQFGIESDKLRVFRLVDYGADLPEDGLYAVDAMVREKPEVARAVAEGTMAGWRLARDNQARAVDEVMRLARQTHVPTNRPQQEYMLRTILPSIFPESGAWRPGRLDPGAYSTMVNSMLLLEHLRAVGPSYEDFVWETAR